MGLFSRHRMAKKLMTRNLLTFELGQDNDQLFIHGDPDGLRRFAEKLLSLADAAEKLDFPHAHMFTEHWGGEELTSEPQEIGHRCLNHVKIYGWPDIRGAAPYKKQ